MRIQLKVKNPKTGRWKIVRCDCCNEPRIFKTWKAAKEHANKVLNVQEFHSKRVTANQSWSPNRK